MKCTMLQPTYLPWLGYFEMIANVDTFVVFDNVQFSRKSWQQRNRIKMPNGPAFLSVPVKKTGLDTLIKDAMIAYDTDDALQNHWRQISGAYKRARYFADYAAAFEKIYATKYERLRDLNCDLIAALCDAFGIKTTFVYASSLTLPAEKRGREADIIAICKAAGADALYDAHGAQEFLDTGVFTANGVAITFQNYEHPTYRQLWGEFALHMSAIDLLFNEGPASREIILSGARDA